MQTIPPFSSSIWEFEKKAGGFLHPGLAFYRFFEVSESRDSKFESAFNVMADKTALSFARELAERVRIQLQALEESGVWKTKLFRAVLTTRLALGLGIPSQSENGLYLDHIHGIPLIPGSALKGITQDCMLREHGIANSDPYFEAVFGAQTPTDGALADGFKARAGNVVFFDAFPIDSENPFDVDIMNPHYTNYYAEKGGKAPADYMKPIPIFFLTVKAGTVFQFALAARNTLHSIRQDDNIEARCTILAGCLLQTAFEHLKDALGTMGVGGKTRVGYGLFEEGR